MDLTLQQKVILGALAAAYLSGRMKGKYKAKRHPFSAGNAKLTTDEIRTFAEIVQEYTDKGLSLKDVAKRTKVPVEDIKKIVNASTMLEIPRKFDVESVVDLDLYEKAEELVKQGKTAEEIGDILGLKRVIIRTISIEK